MMRVTIGCWGERVVQASNGLTLMANAMEESWPAQNKDLHNLGYESHTQGVQAQLM